MRNPSTLAQNHESLKPATKIKTGRQQHPKERLLSRRYPTLVF